MSKLLKKFVAFWRKLRETGVDASMPSAEAKRIRFANLIMFPLMAPALPFGLYLWSAGSHQLALLQLPFTLFFVMIPLLNARRKYQAARFALILGGLGIVICMSIFSGFESGEHLAFIVMLLLAFCVFDVKQRWSLFVSLSLLLAGFLAVDYIDRAELVEHQQVSDLRFNYILNYVLVCCALVMGIYYFKVLSGKQVDDIVMRAQRELRAMFENSVDAILLVAPDSLHIEMCNDRAVGLFGLAHKEDLLGRSIDTLWQTKSSHNFFASTWEVREEECAFLRASGDMFWGNAAYTQFDYAAETHLMVRITDITLRIQAEAALEDAKAREAKALEARDYFLSMMSHELRTPVNGIMGITGFLEEERGHDDELVQMLKISSRRLMHTVSNMLEMTKLEASAHEREQVEVPIHTVVDPIASHYSAQAREKGLKLSLEPQQEAYFVMGQTAFLKQVFDNVVSNAIKFTEQGEIQIRMFEEEDEEWLVFIEVEDTGIGMSSSFIETQLFAKFEQESKGMDRRYEGLGIGMTICKRVIELMGGTIDVKSTQGVGTTVRVALPLVRTASLNAAPA